MPTGRTLTGGGSRPTSSGASCQRCGLKVHQYVLGINTIPVSGDRRSEGIDLSPIEIHRRLAQFENFREVNHFSRDAGRAVQKLNFEYGLEAARIALKGYLAVIEAAEKAVKEAVENAETRARGLTTVKSRPKKRKETASETR